MKKILASCSLLFVSLFVTAQDLSLYEKHLYIKDQDTLRYRLLMPANFDASKQYPLILFLHGAGERGNDNEKQLVHGAKFFLREEVRENFQAIIVFPQCPQNSYWSNVDIKNTSEGKREFVFKSGGEPSKAMDLTQQLLKWMIAKFPVKKKQIYVGGLSMGGMGTFEIVRRNPELFAAAFPICGGGAPSGADHLKKVKWWVFHGAKDNVVPPENSAVMVEALREAKAFVKFTLYPEANHNSWDPAFAEPELLPWLFSVKR